MIKKDRVLISFDYALKRLLRRKANYEVLEGFLSELLGRDVKVKSLGESESNQTHIADKFNRVDILVESEDKEVILVELQFTIEADYFHRMLFGTSKAICERMEQGKEYAEVRKIYSVNIVYFDLGQGEDYVYHGKTRFIGLHTHDELKLSASQRKVFGGQEAGDIFPEYYILKINFFDDVAKEPLDEWIYFFKHNEIKAEFNAKGLQKAREVLVRDNLTPEERKEYDYLQNDRSHQLSMIASAKGEAWVEIEQKLAEKDAAIAEKDAAIAEREAALAEKEAAIARERAEKEAALAELAALKARLNGEVKS
jgi:predicted transposase/invertase (TIGR01784 family)